MRPRTGTPREGELLTVARAMRILLLNQYYPPDMAPTGRYLHDLGRRLAGRGHDVLVLCSRHSYDGRQRFAAAETLDGVRVHRVTGLGIGRMSLFGKCLAYTSFVICLIVRLAMLHPPPDLILSLTTPPYIGLLAKATARLRGCGHAHWVMDIYPDVVVAHGLIRSGGWLHRFFSWVTRWELKGSRLTVTLGPDMAQRLSAYVGSSGEVPWVPLWVQDGLGFWPEHLPNPQRQARGWGEAETVLMYAGNMGLGHRFEEFFETALRLREDRRFRWVFSGGGIQQRDVTQFSERHPEIPMEVGPYVRAEDLRAYLCSADVHLASLAAEWSGCMIPSKIQGIFGVGKPVIFVGPSQSSIASWTRASGGGWVVEPGDVEGLVRAIQEAADPAERRCRGDAARRFAEKHFDPTVNCERLCQMIEQAALRPPTGPLSA